ncbi:MAG TPA: ribonuclease J [Bacilli bacterium]|nr:ribonuclease J [Bacilli bacterium]
MSKIKIFSLGGLDESGKNAYVVEVDESLFVFDCGIKYASENLYGIDYIIPDFEYLIKNKNRIKGLFITHGHNENMGAVDELLEAIPDLKVYATKFTKFVLESEGVPEKNIVLITPHKQIKFGDVSIFPISVSHSIPDAVMYVINTKDGAVCYTGDFIIDPSMMGPYNMDLGKIAYVGKQGVLCLMSESVFSEKIGHTSPSHKLTDFFKDTLNHNEKRVIFTVLPNHLYTISEIFAAAENMHRKIILMGKKLQNVVAFSKKEGYLNYNDKIVGDLSNVDDEDAILLISDDLERQYFCVEKILMGYDKFIKLKSSDTVVFAEPRYDSNEKTFVKLENDIAVAGASSITIPKDKNILHHASSEDLMLMIKLISPKYYMPVKGEYRYMVGNASLAKSLGMPEDNIILKQNGQVVTFVDGLLKDSGESIKVNDVLIDGKSNDDVGELVIKDREMLSENGIVLISATVNKKGKEIVAGPEVTTRGFIYVKDSGEMIKKIEEISLDVIKRNRTPEYVDYNKVKQEIREDLGKYFYDETGCKPMIIAVIQEI